MDKKSEMSRESWVVELGRRAGSYILFYAGFPLGIQVVLMPLGVTTICLLMLGTWTGTSMKNTFLSSWQGMLREQHCKSNRL